MSTFFNLSDLCERVDWRKLRLDIDGDLNEQELQDNLERGAWRLGGRL